MKSWGVVSFRRAGVVLVGVAACGLLSCSALGDEQCWQAPCDGPVDGRSVSSIYSSGFSAPQSNPARPDACEGIGDGGEMRLRFVMIDNEGRPIQLGESVAGRSVELDGQSVQLSGSALMEAGRSGCTSDDECSEGFSCQVAPGLAEEASLRACMRPDDGLFVHDDPNTVNFISDTDGNQVFGVLMEASGSLAGWNPAGSKGAWDKNADGDTDDADDAAPSAGGVNHAIATDAPERRFDALVETKSVFETAADVATRDGRKTYFGLWSFNDQRNEPVSHVAPSSANDAEWTEDMNNVDMAVNDYKTRPAQDSRANVYEAIENLIESQYSAEALQTYGLERSDLVDKQLVVFVDGYDDMRESDNSSIDSAIEAAVDHNVRLFIVHLDLALAEPEALREDPMYPSGQTACADDGECKNFERCARPRGYAPSSGDDVSLPDGAQYDLAQTYCIPRRDDSGRTGPIEDYARLGCATGGGYMYTSSAQALGDNMSWTPLALDGLWEAKVSSSEILRGNAPASSPLRIHTNMSVDVAGRAHSYEFSQIGGQPGSFDNRGVVFTK